VLLFELPGVELTNERGFSDSTIANKHNVDPFVTHFLFDNYYYFTF